MFPIVDYFTADGPTPAIVLNQPTPDTLRLYVIYQSGRTEVIERVKECKEPARGCWRSKIKEPSSEEQVSQP